MRDIEEHGAERRARLPGSRQSQRGALRDGAARHAGEGSGTPTAGAMTGGSPEQSSAPSPHAAPATPAGPTASHTAQRQTRPDGVGKSIADTRASGGVLSGAQHDAAATQLPVGAAAHLRAHDAAPAALRDVGSAEPRRNLGQMTPQQALRRVVDETLSLELEQASKEVHIELEPAHLGPLVVEIKRDAHGQLTVRLRARQAEAARILDAGSDLLRDSLAEAGFARAVVGVEHDDDV